MATKTGYTPLPDFWQDEFDPSKLRALVEALEQRFVAQDMENNDPKGKVPSGGDAGQVLSKTSDEDYDVEWSDLGEINQFADVDNQNPSNRDALMFNDSTGVYENRAIVEADISDLQNYLLPSDLTQYLTESDIDRSNWDTAYDRSITDVLYDSSNDAILIQYEDQASDSVSLHDLLKGVDSIEDGTPQGSSQAFLHLVGDEATPGNNKLYGTDGNGDRGWKDDTGVASLAFSGNRALEVTLNNGFTETQNISTVLQGTNSIVRNTADQLWPQLELENDEESPGLGKMYGTDNSGVRGWKDDRGVASLAFSGNRALEITLRDGFTETQNISTVLQGNKSIIRNTTDQLWPQLELENDEASPEGHAFYGTDSEGNKGWQNSVFAPLNHTHTYTELPMSSSDADNWNTAFDRSVISVSYDETNDALIVDFEDNTLDDHIDLHALLKGTKSIENDSAPTSGANPLQLVGDEASPGNNKVYGTNGSGVKGWVDQFSGDVFDADGTYANLRAQATTKGDVGLGSVSNIPSTSADTPSTVMERNSSGDVWCRLFRSSFSVTNGTIAGIYTTRTIGGDFMRPSTPAQLLAALPTITTGDVNFANQGLNTNDNVAFNMVNLANHEQGDFDTDGDVYYDASAGLYVKAGNVGNDKTGGNLLWSSGNVSTATGIQVGYGSEDEPTIGLTGDSFDSGGNYPSLRAQATTKGDVGLGNVPNTDATDPTNISVSGGNNLQQEIDAIWSALSGKVNTSGDTITGNLTVEGIFTRG